jgi:hypothetical protein
VTNAVLWDVTSCFLVDRTVCVHRPDRSQQNAQQLWSSPLTQISIVAYRPVAKR